jgi:hypothetical protein
MKLRRLLEKKQIYEDYAFTYLLLQNEYQSHMEVSSRLQLARHHEIAPFSCPASSKLVVFPG